MGSVSVLSCKCCMIVLFCPGKNFMWVWLYVFIACVCVGDVVCVGHNLNRWTGWWSD